MGPDGRRALGGGGAENALVGQAATVRRVAPSMRQAGNPVVDVNVDRRSLGYVEGPARRLVI